MPTVTRVPNARVPALKRAYERLGATVDVKDNGDGTSDVTATFPPKQTHAAMLQKATSATDAGDG